MGKKIKIGSGSLIFLLLFIYCCKNVPGKGGVSNYHLVEMDTIRDQYNAVREAKEWATITQGNVNIVVGDNIISFEQHPDSSDEIRTYFLQTRSKDYDLKTDSFGRAEVLFLGRNLIINSLSSKKTMHIAVVDNTNAPFLQDIKGVKYYTGYGLGVRKTKINGLSDNVPFCKCELNGTPDYNCGYGGAGAHGCGNGTPDGSCEVSCSQAYFPCCDIKTN